MSYVLYILCEFYCISGAIDYYINGKYNVGIELMQNGKQLSNHLNRFVNGGEYSDIENYLIIDFHEHENDIKGIYFANCWCYKNFDPSIINIRFKFIRSVKFSQYIIVGKSNQKNKIIIYY